MGEPESDWVSYLDAAASVGRPLSWVRDAANRGRVRHRFDPGPYGRRWVDRQDVEMFSAAQRAEVKRHAPRSSSSAPKGALTIADAAGALEVSHEDLLELLAAGRLIVHSRWHPFVYVDEGSVRAMLAELYGGHDPAEVMTFPEAAESLGITVQGVRRLIYLGRLTSVGHLGWARVLREEVRTADRKTV